jgi:hypothetical protein
MQHLEWTNREILINFKAQTKFNWVWEVWTTCFDLTKISWQKNEAYYSQWATRWPAQLTPGKREGTLSRWAQIRLGSPWLAFRGGAWVAEGNDGEAGVQWPAVRLGGWVSTTAVEQSLWMRRWGQRMDREGRPPGGAPSGGWWRRIRRLQGFL